MTSPVYLMRPLLPPPPVGRLGRLARLSADLSTRDYTNAGTGAASGVVGILSSPTVGGKIASGGGAIMAIAPLTGPIAPFVFVGGALVSIAGTIMSFVGLGDGCGHACILTSQWANQAEDLLKQNASTYFSNSVRTQSEQAVALSNFDAIWNSLSTACSNANLSTAGVNCIGDRKAGACKWHATDSGPWPGSPTQGSCWNWFSAYRDPIAHDTPMADSQFAALYPTKDPLTGADLPPGTATGTLNLDGILDSKSLLLLVGVGMLAMAAGGGD